MERDDTSPDARRFMVEAYRLMTPTQKLRRVFDLYDFAMGAVRADVRRRYPHADDREVRLRAASRIVDRELMFKAFGWDPREKGY
jgi:hypothetical protein